MGQQEEVHARHILVRAARRREGERGGQGQDQAIIARLKNGEDFAKLAKEETEDPSGKANGGDLGYFTKDQMVPEFSKVAFKLKKGEISEPVKTQFGWHVIKVEDKRIKPAPKFEEVKPQIAIGRARRRPRWCTSCAPGPRSRSSQGGGEKKPDAAKPDDKKPEIRRRSAAIAAPSNTRHAPALCRASRYVGTSAHPSHHGTPAAPHETPCPPISPLAPKPVPDMPAIAGVRLATAAAGIRYRAHRRAAGAVRKAPRSPACSRSRNAPPRRWNGAARI